MAESPSRKQKQDALGRREEAQEKTLRQQAASYPRLSDAEEADLLRRRPDKAAQERLVNHNLDLVVQQAQAHVTAAVTFSDLYQDGAMALVTAVDLYSGNGSFRQFLNLHVGLQMDSLIEQENAVQHGNGELVRQVQLLDLFLARFRESNGREATSTEVAELLQWAPERVRKISDLLEQARHDYDASIIDYLDDADADELGLDAASADEDPYRRLPGAGPDD